MAARSKAYCTSTTAFAQDWTSTVATYDNFHSRMVVWAKVILPLVAVGLLSTLFFLARTVSDPGDIPFAEIGQLAREQQITAPTFSGLSTDGSIITITAQSAQPQDGNLEKLSVSDPQLDLNATDGTSLTIFAGEGIVDNEASLARLSGLARLETSNGYLMETTELVADLQTGTVNSLGPLAIIAPFGEITAGLVQIELGQNGEGQQMHFTKGVSMLYNPVKDTR